MMTLWDLIKHAGEKVGVVAAPAKRKPPSGRKPAATRVRRRPRVSAGAEASRRPASATKLNMEERYEQITRRYLAEHGIKVRKWRKGMTGIATQLRFKDGRIAKYIESPRPRGPMSMAVFLHEIGHHVIGFNTYRPRCLEEYHAWRFAIQQMELLELNITESVRRRMHNSLRYAVQKAERRGIREIPAELHAFRGPWQGSPRGPGGGAASHPPAAAKPPRGGRRVRLVPPGPGQSGPLVRSKAPPASQ
jgi:hypothetical protein